MVSSSLSSENSKSINYILDFIDMANTPIGVLVSCECEVFHSESILVGVENPPTNAFLFQIFVRNKIGQHYFVPERTHWEFHNYIHESPHFTKQVVLKFDAISEDEGTAFNAISLVLEEADIPTTEHPQMIANIHSNAARLAQGLGNTENRTIPILVDITKVYLRIISNPYEVDTDEDEDEDEYEEDESVEDEDGDLLDEVMSEVMRFSMGEDTPNPATESSIAALEKVKLGESGGDCTICLEEMAANTEVTLMPCTHMFHGRCIVQWLRMKNVCPLCRFRMPADRDN